MRDDRLQHRLDRSRWRSDPRTANREPLRCSHTSCRGSRERATLSCRLAFGDRKACAPRASERVRSVLNPRGRTALGASTPTVGSSPEPEAAGGVRPAASCSAMPTVRGSGCVLARRLEPVVLSPRNRRALGWSSTGEQDAVLRRHAGGQRFDESAAQPLVGACDKGDAGSGYDYLHAQRNSDQRVREVRLLVAVHHLT